MSLDATTYFSENPDSYAAGKEVGSNVRRSLGDREPEAMLVYAGVSHNSSELLRGVRETAGTHTKIIGCSTQGIVMLDKVTEENSFAAAMAFAGEELKFASAIQRDIQNETLSKGKAMGRSIKDAIGSVPELLVLFYDPLCGADINIFQKGVHEELPCVILGGSSSHTWFELTSLKVDTYQYCDTEAIQNGAVALAFSGPIGVEIGITHGESPVGRSMTVTRSVGNQIMEIDGRSAFEVWKEMTGTVKFHEVEAKHWAIGIEREHTEKEDEKIEVVLAAFDGFAETGGLIFQTAIPEGTKIRIHRRSVSSVLEGTTIMGSKLSSRISSKEPWVTLAFECGARTSSFLGADNTLIENRTLQKQLGNSGQWLGMMPWGEITPLAGELCAFNFTYLLAVLTLKHS
jgi:hypothetical protein